MAKDRSDPVHDNSDSIDREQRALVRKWTQSNRYLNVLLALSERPAGARSDRGQSTASNKRNQKQARQALLTAVLALLVVACAAFLAGLL